MVRATRPCRNRSSRGVRCDVGEKSALGLPDAVEVCLFDLDGVLTRTAELHAAAWKQMFDDYLSERAARLGEPFVPFDAVGDYDEHVDGRPRAEGVRTFL